jgi:hypothetical protein
MLRRKVVLPVTVIRRGEEKQLAHTLDITETSARLGGLGWVLEPGEVIEVQRGAIKAKFEVHWMGEPTSTLSGQAGIRGMDPNKSIWGIQLPADEPDLAIDARAVRGGANAPRGLSVVPANADQHARYECNGGMTLLAPGSNYPIRVQIKNIHVGGFYVETATTLPVKTIVSIETKLDNVQIEAYGVVDSIIPRVGMEIAFHKISVEGQRRVLQVIQQLKQQAWDAQQVPPILRSSSPLPAAQNAPESIPQLPRPDACRVLVTICQNLASDFDGWKAARSASELAELRKAVAELHKKLSTNTPMEEMEYLAATLPVIRA